MTVSASEPHEPHTDQSAFALQLLRTGNFQALDGMLCDLQARFVHDDLTERELLNAFYPFQQPDPALGEAFGNWMEAVPGSYVAHVAFATWLLARAWAYRGRATSDLVSDRGRRGLAHFLSQAEACARHATTLAEDAFAAWNVLSAVARTQGNRLTLEDVQAGRLPDWYLRPLADHPQSLSVRQSLLWSLRTEWGGSDAMMLAYLRSQDGQLSNSDRSRLWAQYHSQVSHHALHFLNDHALGLENARMASELHPAENVQLLTALMWPRASMKPTDQDCQDALDRTLTHLEGHPDEDLGSGVNSIYAALEKADLPVLGRTVSLLARMAGRGSSSAAYLLGRLAIKHKKSGLVNADTVGLLTQAMDQGDARAAMLLSVYHRTAPANRDAADEAMLQGAQLGNDASAWDVYTGWSRFEGKHNLGERDRLRFLLISADAGDNDARVELAGQLRAGKVELGDDGVLRPIAGKPIQESLDYAKHLLERAAHEEHTEAKKLLKRPNDRDWKAETARVQRVRAVRGNASSSVGREPPRVSWGVLWLGFVVVSAVLRACTGSH